ncbi:MAG: hypothetical protein U0X91_03185 [Spirosomataceae bacterium]
MNPLEFWSGEECEAGENYGWRIRRVGYITVVPPDDRKDKNDLPTKQSVPDRPRFNRASTRRRQTSNSGAV